MVGACLSLEGRIGRLRYLVVSTIVIVGVLLGWLVASIVGDLGPVALALYAAGGILALWLSLSAGVRRLHDIGHSGWWMLGYLVPLASLILALVLLLKPGMERANDHGPRP